MATRRPVVVVWLVELYVRAHAVQSGAAWGPVLLGQGPGPQGWGGRRPRGGVLSPRAPPRPCFSLNFVN